MKILKRWRWAEKAVWEVKAYDGVMKNGERIFIKLAKTREIKTRELKCVKCIKDEGHRLLVMEEDNIERWKSCFDKLFMEAIQEIGAH